MAKKVEKHPFPLIIEVKKTFPLRRIKSIYVKDPTEQFRDDINLDRDQAKYLLSALQTILKEDPETTES